MYNKYLSWELYSTNDNYQTSINTKVATKPDLENVKNSFIFDTLDHTIDNIIINNTIELMTTLDIKYNRGLFVIIKGEPIYNLIEADGFDRLVQRFNNPNTEYINFMKNALTSIADDNEPNTQNKSFQTDLHNVLTLIKILIPRMKDLFIYDESCSSYILNNHGALTSPNSDQINQISANIIQTPLEEGITVMKGGKKINKRCHCHKRLKRSRK